MILNGQLIVLRWLAAQLEIKDKNSRANTGELAPQQQRLLCSLENRCLLDLALDICLGLQICKSTEGTSRWVKELASCFRSAASTRTVDDFGTWLWVKTAVPFWRWLAPDCNLVWRLFGCSLGYRSLDPQQHSSTWTYFASLVWAYFLL